MKNFSTRIKTSGWSQLMNTLSRSEMREGVTSLVSAHNANCVAPSSTLSVKVIKKAAQAAAKPSTPLTNTFALRQEVRAHQASKVNDKSKAREAFAKLFA